MLARYASRYLEEEVYPELVKKLGFEPPQKSLFEIFSRSGSTSGHSWFSARMVGLPYIGTVGACAGKIVAVASPNDMPRPFNWARVLKHEFVHVVNLQQTDFNVPRWFTEGLAVWHEGFPRRASWRTILSQRHNADQLFDLDSINYGFARPKSRADWTLAYCQAEIYVEFLVHRFGDDAISKMLDAYGENMDTATALKTRFDIEKSQFEKEYLGFLENLVDETPDATPKTTSFAELQRQVAEDPDNPRRNAELALAHLNRNSKPKARQLAQRAVKKQAGHPLACYVLARLYLSIGDTKLAVKVLSDSLDSDEGKKKPDQRVLALLGAIQYKAGKFADAAELYRKGQQFHPHPDKWHQALARVYLKSNQKKPLRATLVKLANVDTDNVLVVKKLAELAMEEKELEEAGKWALRGLRINVRDADLHATLAQSMATGQEYEKAIVEYEYALSLAANRPGWRFQLADCCVQAKEFVKAKQVLAALLEAEPDYPGATLMLESLPKQ